jgi:hypothetical protein
MDNSPSLNTSEKEKNDDAYLNTTSVVADLEAQVDVQNPLGAD